MHRETDLRRRAEEKCREQLEGEPGTAIAVAEVPPELRGRGAIKTGKTEEKCGGRGKGEKQKI